MTAATATVNPYDTADTRLQRLAAGPAEGWLTLGGVALMIVALGWSVDDANWVGVDSMTDFLPLVGLAGVLVGFVGPKLGWGRWTTHLLGVAFAAMILPLIGGDIVLGDTVEGWGPIALAERYRAMADIVTQVWIDLGVRGLPRTNEFGHYFLAFGALLWATGQFTSYAVFGHRRALDAVIVTGLVLLANMSLTDNPQLHLMVLFTLAALTLLARAHAFDERVTWLRRRIGDPAAVTGLYLRGGAVFISAAVLGSLFLTATASSAPLQGLWRDVPATLAEFSQWLQRYVPLGGNPRNPGIVAFGSDANVTGVWSSNDNVAFRVDLPATETEKFYWLVGTYADFQVTSWRWGETESLERAAREDLLATTVEDPVATGLRREVRFDVVPDTFRQHYVVSPQTIRWVDRDATVRTIGPSEYFVAVEFDGGEPYTATALVPVWGSDVGAVNENRLRVASRDYLSETRRLYLRVPDGAIGPEAQALLDKILARSPADNPYDIAKTMELYLRSRNFRYDTDVQAESQRQCEGVSTVECFARIKAGYCQYYASTMAILLRKAGIPARLAQGFLPGQRGSDGRETVRNSGAHAWVQVYFPGYGWIDFDPTGGDVSEIGTRPSGAPETPTPRPSFQVVTDQPGFTDQEGPDGRSSGPIGPGPIGPDRPTSGPYIAIAGLLVIGVLALGWVAWRRGPRPMHPDRAWGSIARWAARLGLGPRASQTVYEYAGVLGDAVPVVRPELATVANAKVEMAYGRRELDTGRMKAVAEAHRRLRIGLLRLALRRPKGLRRRR
ncbi:MAG TPA: transglutaminase domain-containing protein [Candidatus Limnocylindrales bacterium]|nr:transglutaminase domain-containing protein [Candidatus Limnocylindrales bacterium]